MEKKLLARIERLQAIQKRHPMKSPEWKKASRELAPLFRLMAALQKESAK